MTLNYTDSAYRFTDPIRLYKANDPYYFEVDNIPLKQLQENCNWLKDQLSALAGGDFTGGLGRASFDELRPYANGDDRVIRVKPGRFTARINDASYSDPLAIIEQVGNTNNTEQGFLGGDEWRSKLLGINETSDFAGLYAALEKFKSTLAEDALGCEGLIGRCWTWPTYSEVDAAGANGGGAEVDLINYSFMPGASIGYSTVKLQRLIFPILRVAGWKYKDEPGGYDFLFGGWFDDFYGYTYGPYAETVLLKKWRGIARTAIVNVHEELEIEVPPFDPEDFSYTDKDGVVQSVDGVQSRIDLVFIYSKPVDRTSVGKLNQFNPPEYITKPQLGIVQGAGIRLNQQSVGPVGGQESSTRQEVATDTHKMIASPADQFNENLGFTATSANDITYDVRGSFPAPDDILNLAPLISEKLSQDAYELVGQTILPVAYIWVRGTSEGIQQSVLSTDVIDIRPFFRTTELAYNERVGIAAAMPQLSIANPAVGKGQLDRTAQNLKDYIDAKVVDNNSTTAPTQKTLATGYIFGGWAFGPEGALFNYYSKQQPGASIAEIQEVIRQKYGFGSLDNSVTIPYFPQWDQNTVIRTGNSSLYSAQNPAHQLSAYLKTYVNIFISQNGVSTASLGVDTSIVGGSMKSDYYDNQGSEFGPTYPLYDRDVEKGFQNTNNFGAQKARVKFEYVRKKIKFSRPTNLLDYQVNVQYINCLPQTHPGHNGNLESQGSYTGIWVEKGYDYFTIYCGYSVDSAGPAFHSKVDDLVDDGTYAGFAVMVEDLEVSNPTAIPQTPTSSLKSGYKGNPRMGKCGIPTIMWSMTGIANNGANYFYPNLNGFEPTISLDTL